MDIDEIVADLRREGNDHESVEAKSAKEGFPSRVAETMCALANRPGGGLLIFGLDERDNFAPTTVYDITHCKQSLTTISRKAVTPEVTLTLETVPFEGHDLVCAQVHEADRSHKPVTLRSDGRAYLRFYDSNYPLSEIEEQAFLTNRSRHAFDAEPVAGADPERDFDPTLLRDYLAARRANSHRFAALTDQEILIRTGVLTHDGQISVAGLLMLGFYPQQYMPTFALQMHYAPTPEDAPAIRSYDSRIIGGPISAIIDEALSWVGRNTRTAIVNSPDGRVRNVPTYPAAAVREIVANALIHRDLGPYAQGELVTLRLDQDSLTVANPGGLYGIAVENLGRTPSNARNHLLADIATQVPTADGQRVIERLGTGMGVISRSLSEAGLPPAKFYDNGLRFTVRLFDKQAATLREETRDIEQTKTSTSTHPRLSSKHDHILKLLTRSDLTKADLVALTGYPRHQVEYALRSLRSAGLIQMRGTQGERNVTYSATSPSASPT